MKDYYHILGLPRYAKPSIIAKRHIELTENYMQRRHNGDAATEEFILQTEALYLLKNPKIKARYDRLHAICFSNRPVKRSHILKKWNEQIDECQREAWIKAKELAELTNEELTARNKNLKAYSSLGPARDIFGWILEIFASLWSI